MSTTDSNATTNEVNTTQVASAAPPAGGPLSATRQVWPATAPASASVSGAQAQEQALGVGTEGEFSVWKGRYSFKNFVMRILVRILVTAAWIGVLIYLEDRYHGSDRRSWDLFVWCSIAAVGLFWIALLWQILLARLGHSYELTNRRLFVNTGVFRRRRDQIELLRVQDVYVKQPGLFSRLLDIGTVVIESSEERLPVHYLVGVSDPRALMDTIWHHARKERDLRSVKVDEV